MAVITAVSGIAAAVFEFHHEEGAQTREVFGNIPTAIKAMFYSLDPRAADLCRVPAVVPGQELATWRS